MDNIKGSSRAVCCQKEDKKSILEKVDDAVAACTNIYITIAGIIYSFDEFGILPVLGVFAAMFVLHVYTFIKKKTLNPKATGCSMMMMNN